MAMLSRRRFVTSSVLLAFASTAIAEGEVPLDRENAADRGQFDEDSRRAQRLSDELKSPFCPGKTLKTCTSPNAAKVRREIQDMVAEGLSDDEIVKSLRETYDRDDFSVANPEQPGLTIFVPFLPFVILSGAMLWFVRYWRRPTAKESPSESNEDETRVYQREALRKRLSEEETEV